MYNRILVPLDGSKLSECALAHVKHIVRGSPEPEVVLISVHPEITLEVNYLYGESLARETVEQWKKAEKEMQKKTGKYLSGIAKDLKKEGLTVKAYVIHPDPASSIPETIIKYAEDNLVDLIVMSTHGRSGVSRWAFGSVADRVAHYSKIPVLIVTPAQCRV